MFSKIASVLAGLLVCSCCFAADGLPEGDNWFIQPLAGPFDFLENLQVSDTCTIWRQDSNGYNACYYYDGTGIYELRYNGNKCSQPSLSGSSIVSATSGGIAFHYLGYRQLFPVSQSYFGYPDVYTDLPTVRVTWEAGPSTDQTQVYLNEGNGTICLTDNAQCFNNGKRPVVSAGAVAWLGRDGNDDDVFMYENGVITQMTFNDVDEFDLRMADNGTMAWQAWQTEGPLRGYYYDGSHVRQLSVGEIFDNIQGISEAGVLYLQDWHNDTPRMRLMLHDGTQATTLFEADDTMHISGAAIGGDSIAWIGRPTWSAPDSVYFLKGQQLISWPVLSPRWEWVGVWGNRLVWSPDGSSLYFGEYLGPGCAHRPQMDATGDCKVNLADFMIFAGEWLSCGYDDPAACL